jgi:hypothetical protein
VIEKEFAPWWCKPVKPCVPKGLVRKQKAGKEFFMKVENILAMKKTAKVTLKTFIREET